MKIQESGEMYLESILVIQKEKADVHAIDVAARLGYSKPSVSRALGILTEKNFLTVDSDGVIRFTSEGREYAEHVYERHRVLTDFLVNLGVDKTSAEQDACRIEHVISVPTYEVIKDKVVKSRNGKGENI